MDIVVISVMAVVCLADGWDDITEYAKARETWLRTFLELAGGIPCADTFRRVFTALDPEQFQVCFLSWVRTLVGTTEGKLIAMDGKTVRHSFAREEGKGPLHVVSAWVGQNQLALGQVATDAKSNELTAMPKLLELLDLHGATVTTDAMGCQKKIAEGIVDGGGTTFWRSRTTSRRCTKRWSSFSSRRGPMHSATLAAIRPRASTETTGGIEVRRVFASDDIDWMADKSRSEGMGESRTSCIGCWTWHSTKTAAGSAEETLRTTSRCCAR